MMPYVFISYSHADMSEARTLAGQLKKAAVPHFIDTESIEWGENIPDRVHVALGRATHIVILVSPGSQESQWVAYEMGYARGKGATVVPWLLHPRMKLPGFISSHRYVQSEDDLASFIRDLTRPAKRDFVNTRPRKDERPARALLVAQAARQLRSQHPTVREAGLAVLVENGAQGELLEAIGHSRPEVREAAAKGAATLRSPAALPYLIAGLKMVGKRRQAPLIPNAEGLLKSYGPVALEALLTERAWNSDWRDTNRTRWVAALAGLINDSNVLQLRMEGGETDELVLEACLRSKAPIERDVALAAITNYVTVNNRLLLSRCDDVTNWLLQSTARSTQWVHKLVQEWLVESAMALPATLASRTVSRAHGHGCATGASQQATHDRCGEVIAQRRDGIGYVTLRAAGCREVGNLRVRQPFVIEQSFFSSPASDAAR